MNPLFRLPCPVCRSGADKVSIGSDSVDAAEAYLATGQLTGTSSIEQISRVYGKQVGGSAVSLALAIAVPHLRHATRCL